MRNISSQFINNSGIGYGYFYDISVGLAFSLLTVTGVLGNILTIIVIDRNKHIHNHLTPLLLNLAVGNVICCSSVFPVIAYNSLTSTSILPNNIICSFFKVLLHSFSGFSLSTVAAISVIQCVAVWTNGVSSWLNRYMIGNLIALTWIVPISGAVSLALTSAFESPAHSGRLCNYFCGTSSSEMPVAKAEIGTITIISHNLIFSCLPIIIMAICYILIFYQLRTKRISLEEWGLVAYHIKKRERNFTKMLISIFSSYILCTFPGIILSWNDKTDMFFISSSSPTWLDCFVYILAMTPFSTNPLLYVVSDINYRRAYTETLLCTLRT